MRQITFCWSIIIIIKFFIDIFIYFSFIPLYIRFDTYRILSIGIRCITDGL